MISPVIFGATGAWRKPSLPLDWQIGLKVLFRQDIAGFNDIFHFPNWRGDRQDSREDCSVSC